MACHIWTCPDHPSQDRRSGVCAACLRDRLVGLCPDCAFARPACACAYAYAFSTTPSFPSSSSSTASSGRAASSFSLSNGGGTRQPSFRAPADGRARTPSFRSVVEWTKAKLSDLRKHKNGAPADCRGSRIENLTRTVARSRSVGGNAAAMAPPWLLRRGDVGPSPRNTMFWHFPSPIKPFRRSKSVKVKFDCR